MESEFWIDTYHGLETACSKEIASLGIKRVSPSDGGVTVYATMQQAYTICLRSKLATGMKLVLARTAGSTKADFIEAIRSIKWKPFLRKCHSFDVTIVGGYGNTKVINDLRTTLIQEIKRGVSKENVLPPSVSKACPDSLFSILVRKRKLVILADLFNDDLSCDDLVARLIIAAFIKHGLNKKNDLEIIIPALSDASQIATISEAFRNHSSRAQNTDWYFQR